MPFTGNRVIQKKLIAGFICIILLFFISGMYALQEIYTISMLTKTIYDHPLVVSNAALSAGINISKIHQQMNELLLADKESEIQEIADSVSVEQKQVFEQLDLIKKNILGNKGQQLESETRRLYNAWLPTLSDIINKVKDRNNAGAAVVVKLTGETQAELLDRKMRELTAYARNKATEFIGSAEKSQNRLIHTLLFLLSAGMLVSAGIAFITLKSARQAEKMIISEKDQLQKALMEIKTLRGIIPICAHCKQIRNETGVWKRLEAYIQSHSDAVFSHSICPDCLKKHYPEMSEEFSDENQNTPL